MSTLIETTEVPREVGAAWPRSTRTTQATAQELTRHPGRGPSPRREKRASVLLEDSWADSPLHPRGVTEPSLPQPADGSLTSRVRVDHRSVVCVTQDEHGFHIAELQAVPVFYCIMAGSDNELDLLRNTSQKAI